ncbi:site-2 protease family protein [Haladaptatus sp. F3-133]|uniref:Site-2 protease family protein n=1 Tax=Halorutilus salinus TaxID=2487751 RepID=A0A9Q4GGU6_9EURY|nr:site-2 protease family protein [Halorutilus salinus]MCX2819097.1 site-2 protease family protein [Halorutilus salinus]
MTEARRSPGSGARLPGSLPAPGSMSDSFQVYEVEETQEGAVYYGEPLQDREEVLRSVAPAFRRNGYRIDIRYSKGEYALIAKERQTSVDGVPWKNVALLLATVGTTLFAGAGWYGVDLSKGLPSLLSAWPFAVSVLGVLAVHELGHYVLTRYHDVEASLPYFIPVPNAIGTFGAVISMRDNIPRRRALFDIGVAGPLFGLTATVVVTAVGVTLPPVEVAGSTVARSIELGYPLLIRGIAAVMGQTLEYGGNTTVNPVVVGGWVGAFITFLNLIPVGQLDGAHVARALLGDRIGMVEKAVPVALFGLAGYLVVFEGGRSAFLWAFWGVLALVFSKAGTVTPIDESSVGKRRRAVAVLTLVLGVLCFTPVPISISV